MTRCNSLFVSSVALIDKGVDNMSKVSGHLCRSNSSVL